MSSPDATRVDAFQAHRRHLQRVAYGLLGSVTEAEDVVQEAWLRLQRLTDPDAIEDLPAWLTTVVTRLALDVLASARVRREHYVGTWLPEPVVTDDAEDPARRTERDEQVSFALLVVLERLSVAERGAFLLHDVFGYPFAEAAEILDRTPAATRRLAARARTRVAEARPRFPAGRAEQRELVSAFARACADGDLEALVALLAPDVVWRSDGGGRANAARRAQYGARRVARAMLALARRPPRAAAIAEVNGAPGIVLRDGAGVLTVIAFTVDGGQIAAVDIVRNPDKLRAVAEPARPPGPDGPGAGRG